MLYDVTVTRTGSMVVEASSEEEAFNIVNNLKCSEINEQGSLTGWESSDVELLDDDEINNKSVIYKRQRLVNAGDYLALELYDVDGNIDDCMYLYLKLTKNSSDLNKMNYGISKHFKNLGYTDLYNVLSYNVEDYLIKEFGLIECEERKEWYND